MRLLMIARQTYLQWTKGSQEGEREELGPECTSASDGGSVPGTLQGAELLMH